MLALVSALGLGASSAQGACEPWRASTVLSGQGLLENLVFDRKGGLLLSASSQGKVLKLRPDGKLTTLVDGVHAPGGLRVRDGSLYFNTGDDLNSGLQNLTDGTIDRFRFKSRRRSVWASGLTMPNGLVFLPNGDAVVSRDIGTGTGLTRVRARDRAHPQVNWSPLDDTNGLAVDPSGRWLYTVETFSPTARVDRVRIANPSRIELVAELGVGQPLKALDDLTIDRHGRLYIAANIAGELIRLDPDTGASCVIASGLHNPSAVKFGAGAGWSKRSLYVTGFDGTVTRLSPP